MDGKIKSKESDSPADLQAILGLTVAEKFEELSCDGDWVVQLVQWTGRLDVRYCPFAKENPYKPTHASSTYNEHSIETVRG